MVNKCNIDMYCIRISLIVLIFQLFIAQLKLHCTESDILYLIKEPVVELMWQERRVAENIGEIFVPVRRTSGDLRNELTVICGTVSGTNRSSNTYMYLSMNLIDTIVFLFKEMYVIEGFENYMCH